MACKGILSARCRQGHTMHKKTHNVRGGLNGAYIWAGKKQQRWMFLILHVRRTMQLFSRVLIPARDNCFVCPAQGQVMLRMPAGAGLCHWFID